MLKRLDLRGAGAGLTARLPRPAVAGEAPIAAVQAILADVKARGDAAVRECTERFDGVVLDELRVPPSEVQQALSETPPRLREALEASLTAVAAYHREQVGPELRHERNGLLVRELRRPVARA